MYGSIFLLTLKFEYVINLLLLCLSNLDYKTILLCCQKQSPSKCYSGRFFYYNTFLDSVFFWILSLTTFVGHTVHIYFASHYSLKIYTVCPTKVVQLRIQKKNRVQESVIVEESSTITPTWTLFMTA